jgi:hypothetical protein
MRMYWGMEVYLHQSRRMQGECRLHGMLRRVALVRTDVSEKRIYSVIRVTRIDEVGKTLVFTRNRRTLRKNLTLMMEALSSSETSALTRAIQRNISRNDILHNHRRDNLKSYMDICRFRQWPLYCSHLPTPNSHLPPATCHLPPPTSHKASSAY